MNDLGYFGLVIGVALSCAGIPLPNEVMLAVAGVAVQRGEFDFLTTTILATIGQLAGFGVSYTLARREGEPLVNRFGRYIFVTHAMVERVRRLFKRDGAPILLTGLLLPGLHGGMGLWAGFGGIRPRLFIPLAIVATPLYTMLMLGIGYAAGDSLPAIVGAFQGVTGIVGAVVIVLAAAFVWYSRRKAVRLAKAKFGEDRHQAGRSRQ